MDKEVNNISFLTSSIILEIKIFFFFFFFFEGKNWETIDILIAYQKFFPVSKVGRQKEGSKEKISNFLIPSIIYVHKGPRDRTWRSIRTSCPLKKPHSFKDYWQNVRSRM